MDFFISTSDTPYNHWQLSLLIESFKQINLDNNLIVCLTSKDQNSLSLEKKIIKNLINHKRLYKLVSVLSKKYNYEPLNKIYSLLFALKEGFIKQPFLMFFEPDLVIREKIFLPEENITDFLYSSDLKFNFENAEKNFPNFWTKIDFSKEAFKETWLNLGNIIAFNNFPEDFFEELIVLTTDLVINQKDKIWEDTLKLALNLILLRNPKIRLTELNLESPAKSLQNSHFITYRDGILPDFHKSMFKYNPVSLGNPIEILSNIYNCPNTKYISELANKIIDSK